MLTEFQKRIHFDNCHKAITAGNSIAPCGIAWRERNAKTEYPGHWFLFDLTDGCPNDCTVEFVCIGFRRYPIPVTDEARIIVSDMLAKTRYHLDETGQYLWERKELQK